MPRQFASSLSQHNWSETQPGGNALGFAPASARRYWKVICRTPPKPGSCSRMAPMCAPTNSGRQSAGQGPFARTTARDRPQGRACTMGKAEEIEIHSRTLRISLGGLPQEDAYRFDRAGVALHLRGKFSTSGSCQITSAPTSARNEEATPHAG